MSDTELFDTITSELAEDTPHAEALARPRIRTGAVIWGLLLAALGAWVLWIASTPERRSDALDAVMSLDAFGWTVIVLVAIGGFVTLLALAAVIRRAQRRHVTKARSR